MLLAKTSILVALASVASLVAAQMVTLNPVIASPKPFPARIQADSAFTIKINYPTDTRTDADKAKSPTTIDYATMPYYRTEGCLLPEKGFGTDSPCIARYDAADHKKNLLDATELRAELPALNEKLVVGGRYFISFFSYCTYDETKFGGCLTMDCNPCGSDFVHPDLVGVNMVVATDMFEVVPKGAEDDVPDSEELPSADADSAAGMSAAVSSMAAALVAGAMAVVV